MEINGYYKKYSFTVDTDFTAIMTAPASNNSNHPEEDKNTPHRRH